MKIIPSTSLKNVGQIPWNPDESSLMMVYPIPIAWSIPIKSITCPLPPWLLVKYHCNPVSISTLSFWMASYSLTSWSTRIVTNHWKEFLNHHQHPTKSSLIPIKSQHTWRCNQIQVTINKSPSFLINDGLQNIFSSYTYHEPYLGCSGGYHTMGVTSVF